MEKETTAVVGDQHTTTLASFTRSDRNGTLPGPATISPTSSQSSLLVVRAVELKDAHKELRITVTQGIASQRD
ncbi:unnamed protein product [Nippostrongylus brasiliensis]|uniref:Uncharacterized protein n=1 Tax=Nippostrongylus brasiliensis TaxID=27835 RepID=A0A0N4XPZ1_NIPBR|nr:unnamed protein product [Nippostrongylus brasiliensis]